MTGLDRNSWPFWRSLQGSKLSKFKQDKYLSIMKLQLVLYAHGNFVRVFVNHVFGRSVLCGSSFYGSFHETTHFLAPMVRIRYGILIFFKVHVYKASETMFCTTDGINQPASILKICNYIYVKTYIAMHSSCKNKRMVCSSIKYKCITITW